MSRITMIDKSFSKFLSLICWYYDTEQKHCETKGHKRLTIIFTVLIFYLANQHMYHSISLFLYIECRTKVKWCLCRLVLLRFFQLGKFYPIAYFFVSFQTSSKKEICYLSSKIYQEVLEQPALRRAPNVFHMVSIFLAMSLEKCLHFLCRKFEIPNLFMPSIYLKYCTRIFL